MKKRIPDSTKEPEDLRGYIPVINFIKSDSGEPTHGEIPTHNDSDISLLISETPLPPVGIDLYILPVSRLYEIRKPRGSSGIPADIPSGIPVIAYGPVKALSLAFESGCSDYMKEPWDYQELKIRSGRFLARGRLIFEWGEVRLKPMSMELGSLKVALSPPEGLILSLLAAHSNRTVHREALHYALWGEVRPSSRAVDVHVATLRKKFNLLAGKTLNPCPLRSVHGMGYTLIHRVYTGYSGCG